MHPDLQPREIVEAQDGLETISMSRRAGPALAVTLQFVQGAIRTPPGCTIFGCTIFGCTTLAVPVHLRAFWTHLIALNSVSDTFQWLETRSPCLWRFNGKLRSIADQPKLQVDNLMRGCRYSSANPRNPRHLERIEGGGDSVPIREFRW